METHRVIEMVKTGQKDPLWHVFRYNKIRAFLLLLYKLFFTGIFLTPTIILFTHAPQPLTQDTRIVITGLFATSIIGCIFLIRHIYTLFFSSSNMIVLTETEVIKSIRGQITSWKYENMQNTHIVVSQSNKSTMPTYSIEFNDKGNNGHLTELVRGNEFDKPEKIFDILKTKINF